MRRIVIVGDVSVAKAIGFVGLCALFSLIVVLGGNVSLYFIDTPSFVSVVGVTYFALLLTYGSRAHSFMRHSLHAFFRQGVPPCAEFRGMAKWGGIYALVSGGLVCLICLEQMFCGFYGSDPGSLFSGFGISLIPVLYGGLFNLFIFMPLNRLWAGQEHG